MPNSVPCRNSSAYPKESQCTKKKHSVGEYKPAQPPQPNFEERIEIAYKKLGIERKPENKVSDE